MHEDLERRIAALEVEVAGLKDRNRRVEAEKAWETSPARKVLICVLTYAVIAVLFWSIGVEHYLSNALVPTVAYWLSTQSVPLVKRWWMGRR